MSKSGIYQIKYNNCDVRYIARTKRMISSRFNEHIAHYKQNRPEKSAVAAYYIETDHSFNQNNKYRTTNGNYQTKICKCLGILLYLITITKRSIQ